MNPDPIADLVTVDSPLSAEATQQLQHLSEQLPTLIRERTLRPMLRALPVFEMSGLAGSADFRIVERVFQIYAHLANTYVWCEEDNPLNHLPPSVAVPLVTLAKIVERPPIIPYASTALSNWQRIDPDGPIAVENLRVIQEIVAIPDESWFHLIHVEIEQHAATAVAACQQATAAAQQGDEAIVAEALGQVVDGLSRMTVTFKRMPERCHPNTYFHTLRPYLFGFDNIIYEGVAEFGGKPQTLTGETGAQSSVIPAIKTFLGLQHEQGSHTRYLVHMQAFMPKPHRELIQGIDVGVIRGFVRGVDSAELTDIYNAALEALTEFRTLHLHYANAYIATKVADPRGTGGTDFMRWLKQLRDETTAQRL